MENLLFLGVPILMHIRVSVYQIIDQLLQLCTAHTVWSNAVIRSACFSPFWYMCYPDGDPIGKPCMFHRQTLYDSIVLTKDTRVIRGCPLMVTSETSFDSVVLIKDNRVKGGLPIDQ